MKEYNIMELFRRHDISRSKSLVPFSSRLIEIIAELDLTNGEKAIKLAALATEFEQFYSSVLNATPEFQKELGEIMDKIAHHTVITDPAARYQAISFLGTHEYLAQLKKYLEIDNFSGVEGSIH